MLTNVLLGVSAPDAAGRVPEAVATGAQGDFSKVISETEKVSQAIEINEEKVTDDLELMSREGTVSENLLNQPATPASADADGNVSLAADMAPLNQPAQMLVADASAPLRHPDSTAHATTASASQTAEDFHSGGRILPEPVAAPSMQPPERWAALSDQAVRPIVSPDRATPDISATARGADLPGVSGLTGVSGSVQAAGTTAGPASGPGFSPAAVPSDVTLTADPAQKPDQTAVSAYRAQTPEPLPKPGAATPAPLAADITGTRATEPAAQAVAGSGTDSSRQANVSAVELRTPPGEDTVSLRRQPTDFARTSAAGPLAYAAGPGDVATGSGRPAVTPPAPSIGAADLSTAETVKTLPDGAARQLPPGTEPSTLAARLNQLNAANRTTAEESLQIPMTATVKVDQATNAAAPGVVAASLSGLQKSDVNLLSVRAATRDRVSRQDARGVESQLNLGSTPVASESVRADSAILRGDSSAALAQLPAALARQVLHSHAQNISELRLQLKPEELGSMELKLRVDGDRVHVAMLTAQPGVKDLLEAQLPQLRSLLEQGGLQLGDVDVAERGPDGSTSQQEGQFAAQTDKSAAEPDGSDLPVNSPTSRTQGLIDAFV